MEVKCFFLGNGVFNFLSYLFFVLPDPKTKKKGGGQIFLEERNLKKCLKKIIYLSFFFRNIFFRVQTMFKKNIFFGGGVKKGRGSKFLSFRVSK